ncbi:hypothetical protein CDD82_3704 [Ophiocordyceps australis]|uniref:Uncharacterized protein n=1 Tax=Ophiocordyceps australis TaxID=1399860 RepID=A0A2C5YG10_9HYPO|nr:hypothetical protein CDD82_3704 [Ophiocordyceps australis]
MSNLSRSPLAPIEEDEAEALGHTSDPREAKDDEMSTTRMEGDGDLDHLARFKSDAVAIDKPQDWPGKDEDEIPTEHLKAREPAAFAETARGINLSDEETPPFAEEAQTTQNITPQSTYLISKPHIMREIPADSPRNELDASIEPEASTEVPTTASHNEDTSPVTESMAEEAGSRSLDKAPDFEETEVSEPKTGGTQDFALPEPEARLEAPQSQDEAIAEFETEHVPVKEAPTAVDIERLTGAAPGVDEAILPIDDESVGKSAAALEPATEIPLAENALTEETPEVAEDTAKNLFPTKSIAEETSTPSDVLKPEDLSEEGFVPEAAPTLATGAVKAPTEEPLNITETSRQANPSFEETVPGDNQKTISPLTRETRPHSRYLP